MTGEADVVPALVANARNINVIPAVKVFAAKVCETTTVSVLAIAKSAVPILLRVSGVTPENPENPDTPLNPE